MQRLYYGWVIVLACNLVACVTWGVAIFNQGIFVAYYVKAFGWSLPALSIAPVLFHLTAGGAGVLVGRVVDKHGARPALLGGAVFLTAALLGIAYVSELWHVYLAFPLLGIGFACIHTVTIGKIVSRWFLAKRTRAMASATFGAGFGGALLVPLNVFMIQKYGLLGGSLTLIAVSVLILVPLALFVIKDGPEVLGQYVDGAASTTVTAEVPSAAENRDAREWSVAEAMRTAAFYALAFCFAFGMLAQSAFLFHQAPFLEATVGLMGAASIVSVTTLSGLVGRVGFILVGDRMTPRAWCTIVFTCQAVAFLILALAETPLWLTLGSALFGLTMGLVITLQPLGVAYMFGPSINTLVDSAETIKTAMRSIQGARDIEDDWSNPTVTVQVRINQDAARRSGITSADVADALNSQLAGAKISDYRLGDISIPVIARAKGEARRNLDRLRSLTIPTSGGTPVPLLQIAELNGAPNYARIKRQDIERVITVSAVSSEQSAAAFNDALSDTLEELKRTMPPGYRIELGGEVEGSSDANERLASNFPIALALMVLTLIWQFNSFIRPALILAVIPLTVTGFGVTLALAPGANFGFMAILGVLALAGIVVNNAIILIDRIDVERTRRDTIAEAIIEAGVRRLRPIVMTTCTTALGLAPIIIARDVLFYDLALVIAGGLLIGTMLTLIVIPCLYGIVFGIGANKRTDQQVEA